MLKTLLERIEKKRALVGVIGLGYVGLPLVDLFASKGFRVLGFDTDPEKVRRLNRGESYILSVPSAHVRRLRRRGFEATSDPARLGLPDALVICVPTPLTEDRRPDLSFVKKTAEAIRRTLRKGQLVSLESTTYPGTTREVLLPELARSGLAPGKDFFVAFSPERTDPGSPARSPARIPKVVGALDPDSRRAAAALYSKVVPRVVEVSSAEAAEAAKLLENVYRAVNIALVNELKVLFTKMGIDVWEVIRAAATKPFGYQPFYPGPGWGAHCIPLDPFYLAWKAREYQFNTRFIELAGEINTQMPFYVMSRLEETLQARRVPLRRARVLLVGVAYKRDIDDPRESPAFPLIRLLEERGIRWSYHDPFISTLPRMRRFPGISGASRPLTPAVLRLQDAVLIVTDHSQVDYAALVRHSKLVIDTRNATADVPGREGKVVMA